ncbi:hypothetical protein NPIL_471441 [Nephila pilipes]|uniref:C2H2-type domain-containing protein n=1 Tax=Nephila pilipes TaxID=299642 RepID=A0A8X6TYP4_NEPPI|nr:hypothetical protein NPIL_471441 [Nephila pilipes]
MSLVQLLFSVGPLPAAPSLFTRGPQFDPNSIPLCILRTVKCSKLVGLNIELDCQLNMSSTSPRNLTPLGESASQEPKSTTPIALRTRRCATQITFLKAAHLKECKICSASFKSITKLRTHVLNHKPNTKRRKAIEAIDSILKDSNPVQPTPTIAVPKKGAAPTKLFSRFAKVFLELFSEELPQDTRPFNSSHTTPILKPTKIESEVSGSALSPADLHLSTEVSSCLNDVLESIDHIQDTKNILLPAISSILELEEDLRLSSSSSSENSINENLQTSTPLSNESAIVLHSVSSSPPSNNITQDQGSSSKFSEDHGINQKDLPVILHNSHNIDRKIDKEISVLDLILYNSQESLDADFVSQHSPPPKTLSTNIAISTAKNLPSPTQCATAALEGKCLICSKPLNTSELLQHLYKHKSGPLRAKCLTGFRSSFPPHSLPMRVKSNSPPPSISSIEKKFRENFPELPVFQKGNSPLNSSSSSDEEYLIDKLGSPPTGPPKVSPFKKALFSRVVKKGLYRCEFCEKSFITEAGASKHRLQIHQISPHITKASFMPDCSPEMCRVCFKGPAPYKSIAEHYKFMHNLEISSNTKGSSSNTISIFSQDFVSTEKKHIRSFLPIHSSSTQAVNVPITKKNSTPQTNSTYQNSYSGALITNLQVSSNNVKSKPSPSSTAPNLSGQGSPAKVSPILKPSLNNISLPKRQETKIFHNLKIVSRPELGGLGPSKIVSYPTAKPPSNSIPSSSKPNSISVTAEVYHANSSQDPRLHSSPRKCSLCPFVAIKYCGLRLHYFKEHNLRKIPASHNSAITVPSVTHLSKNSSSKSKPATLPHVSSLRSNNTSKPFSTNPMSKSSSNRMELKSLSHATNRSIVSSTSPQAPTTIPTTSDPVIASSSSTITPTIVPMVSFINPTLQYSFPLQTRLKCPLENCSASFGTKSWFTTNTSIKKHLNVFHHQKPTKVLYHCSICDNRITKNPAKHSCLINNLVLPPAVIDGDHWVCDVCESFSTNSHLAKKNHLDANARETTKAFSSKLIIPPSSKTTKKLKSKRVSILSEGPPGSIPLAPPLPGLAEDSSAIPEDSEPLPKIDTDRITIRLLHRTIKSSVRSR